MIEQTEMVISNWEYHPPSGGEEIQGISNKTSLDVMKKRAADKKGIACRFTCHFTAGEALVLLCSGENTYVIDLEDEIDKNELLRMIRNAYAKFGEKFDLRKMGTILQNKTLTPLDESGIDIDAILPLLAT